MTSKRVGRKAKAVSGAGSRKLRVKKETLKDLDAKRRGAEVKGGLVGFSVSPTCLVTCNCFTKTCAPCRL